LNIHQTTSAAQVQQQIDQLNIVTQSYGLCDVKIHVKRLWNTTNTT